MQSFNPGFWSTFLKESLIVFLKDDFKSFCHRLHASWRYKVSLLQVKKELSTAAALFAFACGIGKKYGNGNASVVVVLLGQLLRASSSFKPGTLAHEEILGWFFHMQQKRRSCARAWEACLWRSRVSRKERSRERWKATYIPLQAPKAPSSTGCPNKFQTGI